MKKTKNISIILRIVCALTVMLVFIKPTTVSAESPVQLNIGGESYTLTSATLPAGLSWDAASSTLILNNYTGAYIHTIKSEGNVDLNIHLIGDNVLEGRYVDMNARLYVYSGVLTITAEKGATLTATSTSMKSRSEAYALVADDIHIKGGNIEITTNAAYGVASCCKCYDNTNYGTLYISDDASVTMKLDAGNVTDSTLSGRMYGVWGNVDISTSGDVSFYGTSGEENNIEIFGFYSADELDKNLKIQGKGSLFIETTGMATTAIQQNYPLGNESDYQTYGAYNGQIYSVAYKGAGATITAVSEKTLNLAAPQAGAIPQTKISGTQFSGTVSWSDGVNVPTQFGTSKVYTATVTLVPRSGYTFEGIAANYFSAADATEVKNTANSNVVTIIYPATAENFETTFTGLAIAGVTPPVAGAIPVTTIPETAEYTGTVSFSPAHSQFQYGTVYTATITLTPKEGYTNLGVPANAYTVAGATATNDEDGKVIKAVFPITPEGQVLEIDGVTYWLSDIISPQLPEGLSWDNEAKMLTLHDYKGTYIAAPTLREDLKIHLKGNNELYTTDSSLYDAACIWTNYGDITISADEGAALKAVSSGTKDVKTISTYSYNGSVFIHGGKIELLAKPKHSSQYYAAYCCYAGLNISGDANVAMILDATQATKSISKQGVCTSNAIEISTSGNVSFLGIADEADEVIDGFCGSNIALNVTGTGNVYVNTTGQAFSVAPTYNTADYTVHGTYNSNMMCITHKNCSYIVVDKAVESTCTHAGLTEGSHCTVCETTVVAQNDVPALGHDVQQTVEKASLNAAGLIYKECNRCGEITEEAIAKVAEVSLTATSYTYDGTAKTPSVVVKDSNGAALVSGTDYTTVYSNNVNVGMASATVTGKGNYEFTKTLSFVIAEKPTEESGSTGEEISTEDIEDIFETDTDTATQIQDVVKEYKISADTLKINKQAITAQKNDKDMKGSSFGKLKAKVSKNNKTSITLKWSKVKGADGYIIYGNRCNSGRKKYSYKKLKTLSKNKTSYTAKKLKKGTYYKFIVVAYKKVGNQKVTLTASPTLHTVTKGGKYGVAKSVKITKIGTKKNTTKITLKKGKTAKITAKEVKESKKIKQHRALSYESSNTKIATVSKTGKIKAKKKGTCKIYVYAQNGVYKTISVTVK